MKKKISAAVIGLGFGETHIKALKKINNCKILKICDLNTKKKNYFKNKYQINFFNNYNKIINDSRINLVTIATYDDSHYKILKDSLKKKKNVFIEKPLCQNFTQLNKIKKILKKNKKLKISTNMVLRNHPKFLKIKQIIDTGKIGKIFHIEGEYNYGRFYKIINGWRGKISNYSVTLGGGIHIIDLFQWYVASKVTKVIGIENNLISEKTQFKYPDTVTALLKFENGVTGKITSNFPIKTSHHHILNIHGSEGSIFCSRDNIYLYKTNNKSNKQDEKKYIIKFNKNKNYKYGVIENFVQNILKGKKLLFNEKTIFHNMNVALSIDKSLKSKKWEKIKL